MINNKILLFFVLNFCFLSFLLCATNDVIPAKTQPKPTFIHTCFIVVAGIAISVMVGLRKYLLLNKSNHKSPIHEYLFILLTLIVDFIIMLKVSTKSLIILDILIWIAILLFQLDNNIMPNEIIEMVKLFDEILELVLLKWFVEYLSERRTPKLYCAGLLVLSAVSMFSMFSTLT